jgi:hypothetical protein
VPPYDDERIERRHLRGIDDAEGWATGILACDYCGQRLVVDREDSAYVCPDGCLDELDDEDGGERQ